MVAPSTSAQNHPGARPEGSAFGSYTEADKMQGVEVNGTNGGGVDGLADGVDGIDLGGGSSDVGATAGAQSVGLNQTNTSNSVQRSNSLNNTTQQLRSRKPSLSLTKSANGTSSAFNSAPSSASSTSTTAVQAQQQSAPTNHPTSPTLNRSNSSEVGLGLMLDDEHSQAGSGGRGRVSTEIGSRSAEYLAKITAAASSGNNHQHEDGDISFAGSNNGGDLRSRPSSPSVTGDDGGLSSWPADSFARPRASSSTRPARISTTGGSPNPLMIYTGSPATSSPRPLSPSLNSAGGHLPPPNPYTRPSSAQSNGSYHSTVTIGGAGSIPMSRPGSTTATSVGMDRISSASKSRTNADPHSRQQSLSSACAPVTSGYSTPLLEGQSSPVVPARGWKQYDWGAGKEGGGASPTRDVDDDPHRKAAGAVSNNKLVNAAHSAIGLPATMLSFFIAPLTSTSSSGGYYGSPALSASTAPTSKAHPPKRYSLVTRLLTVSYLVFSTFFLAAKLLNYSSPSSSSAAAARLKALRIGPRADALVGLAADVGSVGQAYAQKAAGAAVRWSGRGVAGRELTEEEELAMWEIVKRPGSALAEERDFDTNPLTPMTHTYRFSKMHDKIHWDLHDEIVSFAFASTGKPATGDVTACLYSNEAWLETLPQFVKAWGGPVSLVFEAAHSRTSPLRPALIDKIEALRTSDPSIRELVDFHIVGTPVSMSARTQSKTRERLIADPRAFNFHHNLARFFAPTDIVFMVGDARFVPSAGLRRRLLGSTVKELVMEDGDAIVVPTFAFVRDPTMDPTTNVVPSITELREELGLPAPASLWDGVSEAEFAAVAQAHVSSLYSTLPLQPSEWPARKSALVTAVSTKIGTPESPTPAQLAMYDRRWDLNHGPSNWYLWRKSSVDPRLAEPAEIGGGIGLGVDGRVGGGNEVYKVMDYDLHFSPNVVVSRKGQPWCTERFDHLQAACVYQMYLSGAQMWVLPDEWLYTLEEIEKTDRHGAEQDPADKLKKSISSRLYGKFHQEACMHYGREFLSIQMWNSEKAQQLRETCARTLSSWGMGAV